ncbi:hypothetical protein [Variovorax sp.]|uniref:hypothetical protein n=1 Tax=Variovorax sp. TaxID=1871043 RepID=UPI0025E60C4E|nr:hypothetical protein [Variovorax sp.]
MPTLKQLPSGNWRAQVHLKGVCASKTFRRHKHAREWALATDRRIDLGEPASRSKVKDPTTFGDLTDLHVTDMKEVLQIPRRSNRLLKYWPTEVAASCP